MGWRISATILSFFGVIIGMVVWLFFYAEDFSVYQNIAVVAVIILGFLSAMGTTWATWGMKYGAKIGRKSDTCTES